MLALDDRLNCGFRRHVTRFGKTLIPSIHPRAHNSCQIARQSVTLSTALLNMQEILTDCGSSEMHARISQKSFRDS